MRRWDYARDDEMLRNLHAKGLEDREIALAMDFEVSTIIGKRCWMKLPSNKRPTHPETRALPQRDPPPPKDKPSPLYTASAWLGARLSERPGSGYWLDGRPASLNTIMREANRVIAEAGAEQVGNNPDWLFR